MKTKLPNLQLPSFQEVFHRVFGGVVDRLSISVLKVGGGACLQGFGGVGEC